jgi:signal transduction histidine kinase/DNA-binding response OmpR family regulator
MLPNILVVDDKPANLQLLVRVLRKQYTLHPAANGAQALELARSLIPDLILLDIMMPDMSGYEVCEHLKADAQTHDIPVIFISALDEEVDKVKGFALGAVDYITKPFQAGEVLARVQTHLAIRNLQKSLQEKNVQLEREIRERAQIERELRAQKQLFENLVAVARATAERPTLEGTLQNVLNVAITLTGAERGSIFLVNTSGAVTHSILARREVKSDQRPELLSRVMDKGVTGWVFRHRQAALINDTLQDERWLVLTEAPDLARSALVVPILSGATVIGILTLLHAQPGCFTAEHAGLMQAAADQMALAVRNAQIFDELRHLADRQITLYETLRGVSGQLDPDAVLQVAVQAISEFVGWPNVAVFMPNDDRTELVVRTSRGDLSPAPGFGLAVNRGVAGRAFRTGTMQHIPDVSLDPDYVLLHPAIRSLFTVPIKRGEQILGILSMESNRLDAFGPDDIVLAESLAEAIALALENAALFQATRREHSRLEALIESSRDGIVFIGLEGYIRVINQPALDLLRLPGEHKDWLERRLVDVLRALRRGATVRQAALAELHRIRQGVSAPNQGETEISSRSLRWMTLPVMSEGSPLGWLVVLRDVTEERTVERLREDMTRTMVHDLRNPLTSIVSSFGLLYSGAFGEIPAQQREILDMAERNARRMRELVNSILDVSRLESGRMPVEWQAFSLPALVQEALEMQAALAGEKAIRLVTNVPPDLPAAWADKSLIGRVLQNLVGNALKFTPPEGVIRVTAKREDSTLLVAVSDSGPGIPPEIQTRLFQKFVTGRQEGRGSGLGLAFCKLAIEAHGGKIWVESQSASSDGAAHGTTFTFTLGTEPKAS